ncbi:MAG TPA: twin-arginine translocase subunit TatC [Candidatus Saccharimonadales bacterium]|nr:twin-arginine translocase subunit TatC [Candidatus Saccharimonadales bacterium]
MKNKHKATSHRRPAPSNNQAAKPKQPFIEHLHELRRRLYKVAASVVLWGAAAYGVQQQIVNILLKPAHGQSFIYTSPGGGIDFLFRVCLYAGLALSIPVAFYQLLAFLEPVIKQQSRRFIVVASIWSGFLALAGIAFGYFLGLPSALHFLLHQFTTIQIKPLVTIQSYLGFVLAYMLGSALLFQLPIILLFINRIKPLKPSSLLKLNHQRWVILAAFVLAGLMNPTPNMLSQMIVAGPFILMYQIGIALVAISNRRYAKVAAWQQAEAQAEERLMELVYEEPELLEAPATQVARPRPLKPEPGAFMDFMPANRISTELRPKPIPPRPQQQLSPIQMRRPRRLVDFDLLPPNRPQPSEA